MAEAFLRTTGGDPQAMRPLLDSFVDSSREEISAIDVPTLILCGRDDHDNGSAEQLAGLLADAKFIEMPGNHMTAVLQPELGQEIGLFLAAK
jgi:pimeloyl-ACP methyl ester carboxylesterase